MTLCGEYAGCICFFTKKDVPGTAKDVYYAYTLTDLQTRARFGSINGQGVTTHYNGFGEITAETTNMGGTPYTLDYDHDANGNRTEITYPDGETFTVEHDGLNRAKFIRHGSDEMLTYGYDRHGRPETLITSGGVYSAIGYDNASRLEQLDHVFGDPRYDLGVTFGYNPASQITAQDWDNGHYHHQGEIGHTGSYEANGLNQYDVIDGRLIGYDDNGNMTSDGVSTYDYDVENRLTKAYGPGNAELSYDPKGRLYQLRTWDYQGQSSSTYFLYSGDALVAEYEDGQMTKRYVHGGGRLAPLIRYEGDSITPGNRLFLHTNHQGSVIAGSDNNGDIEHINTYDAFGVPGAGNAGRFAYTGQMHLPELGLYHYRARVYHPRIGRFLQTDPVGYEDQMNLYAYVHNDPLNYFDPSGMQSESKQRQLEEIYVYPDSSDGFCTCLFGAAARQFVETAQSVASDPNKYINYINPFVAAAAAWNAYNESNDSQDGEVQEEYDSLDAAVGSVNPLDEVELEGKTKDPGLRSQGYTEKWTGIDSDGEWQSAFKNPKTGKFTGGHRFSKNDKFW